MSIEITSVTVSSSPDSMLVSATVDANEPLVESSGTGRIDFVDSIFCLTAAASELTFIATVVSSQIEASSMEAIDSSSKTGIKDAELA